MTSCRRRAVTDKLLIKMDADKAVDDERVNDEWVNDEQANDGSPMVIRK